MTDPVIAMGEVGRWMLICSAVFFFCSVVCMAVQELIRRYHEG